MNAGSRCLQIPEKSMSRFKFATVALAVALGASPPALSAESWVREVRGGVLAHDVPDLWSGFSVEDASVAINVEALLEPNIPFLGGAIRPALGASIAAGDGTSSAYIDARWEIECSAGIFFDIGLGAAVHNGQTELIDLDQKALGSRVLFHIPAEIGYRLDDHNAVSIYFEHMSNANTADVNEGLDRLGVRYGYRF
jgi:lipid A 3-O-deacylase